MARIRKIQRNPNRGKNYFYDIPKRSLIIPLDGGLRKGSKEIPEIPNAYDPTCKYDRRDVVFEE